MVDICCIGHLTIDLVITPTSTVQMPGGTAFYFSKAISKLPVKYKLITTLAAADRFAADELETAGIEMTIHTSAKTLCFENSYELNTDLRKQKVLQVAKPFTISQVQGCEAAVYHLGSLLSNDFSPELIKWLSKRGSVALDAQGLLRKVENKCVVPVDCADKHLLLPFIHTLKASEEEALLLTGEGDMHLAAKLLQEWGVKEVVITMGSKGSLIVIANKIYTIPAYTPVYETDATGCGDTFMAGYLYQRYKGADPIASGKFGAAMASIKIASSGPFTGTEAEVFALIELNQTNGTA